MIDWGRLNELREEIGAEDLAEVVAVFLEEADEVMGRVTAGLSSNRMEEDLHFLKGSALNLGLRDLAELCQEGEKRAAAGHGDPVDLARLSSLYQASKAAFMGAMEKGNAA